jgi:DcmR-like sensory protein
MPAHGYTESGIPGIGKLPWAAHICHVYVKREELVQSLIPYFRTGLENNERCLWITSEPLGATEAKEALGAEVAGLEDLLKEGRIQISDWSAWYRNPGSTNGDFLLRWLEEEKRGPAAGSQGVRIAVNMSWIARGDWTQFMEFEWSVNAAIRNRRILALCSYSFPKCEEHDIFDIIRTHQLTLDCRDGLWSVLEAGPRRLPL